MAMQDFEKRPDILSNSMNTLMQIKNETHRIITLTVPFG